MFPPGDLLPGQTVCKGKFAFIPAVSSFELMGNGKGKGGNSDQLEALGYNKLVEELNFEKKGCYYETVSTCVELDPEIAADLQMLW